MSIQDWFPRLPEHIRESLLENPEQDIPAEINRAITQARGVSVPIGGWVSLPGSESAHLSQEEIEWIREHGGDIHKAKEAT